VPRLKKCVVYPGIYLKTEKKVRENLSQGSQRMPVGTRKTEYTEQSTQTLRIQKYNNKNFRPSFARCAQKDENLANAQVPPNRMMLKYDTSGQFLRTSLTSLRTESPLIISNPVFPRKVRMPFSVQ